MLQVFVVFGVLVALNIGITRTVSDTLYEDREGSVTIDNVQVEPSGESAKQ